MYAGLMWVGTHNITHTVWVEKTTEYTHNIINQKRRKKEEEEEITAKPTKCAKEKQTEHNVGICIYWTCDCVQFIVIVVYCFPLRMLFFLRFLFKLKIKSKNRMNKK